MCVVRIPVSSSLEYIDTCREPPAGWRLALKTPRQQTALAAVGEVGGRGLVEMTWGSAPLV